jgi:hypothetical protein
MKKATDIHRKAMDLVDRARAEKARGESRHAEESLRDAFENEREAALLVVKEEGSEPTRSVLCRSAASLALQVDEIREAERLISLGLAGNPPEDIAEELLELRKELNGQRRTSFVAESKRIQLDLTDGSVASSGEQLRKPRKTKKNFPIPITIKELYEGKLTMEPSMKALRDRGRQKILVFFGCLRTNTVFR